MNRMRLQAGAIPHLSIHTLGEIDDKALALCIFQYLGPVLCVHSLEIDIEDLVALEIDLSILTPGQAPAIKLEDLDFVEIRDRFRHPAHMARLSARGPLRTRPVWILGRRPAAVATVEPNAVDQQDKKHQHHFDT